MQAIETMNKDGKIFAVLPLEDFEDLIETLEDYKMLPVVEARMAALDMRTTESFPSDFSQKLCAANTLGERIALWRDYRGMSRSALGEVIGSSGQYISMIESGKREGKLTTIYAISKALNCDLDLLLPR